MSFNTIISRLFRVAVGIHFLCLCVLFFGMTDTIIGVQYYRVAVGLTILIIVITALLITDMATRTDPSRRFGRLIDCVVGCIWIAVEAILVLNSLRAGQIGIAWIVVVVASAILAALTVLLSTKIIGRVRHPRAE